MQGAFQNGLLCVIQILCAWNCMVVARSSTTLIFPFAHFPKQMLMVSSYFFVSSIDWDLNSQLSLKVTTGIPSYLESFASL